MSDASSSCDLAHRRKPSHAYRSSGWRTSLCAALVAVCVASGLGHVSTARGESARGCHPTAIATDDRLIVPGERIGSLRLDGKITDIETMCGAGFVAVHGGPRKPQLFSLETWNPVGLWVQFDSVTGNVVWISVEVNDANPWREYRSADGVQLGMSKEDLVKVMGPPERAVTSGGYTSLYYDRRGIRFTLADFGRLAGRVGGIRVVWRSVLHGDGVVVPGQRISNVELGMDVGRALALLGGGYHEGEAQPGFQLYYWPQFGLSFVERQDVVIAVRAARQAPSDAAGIAYRTEGGLGQGSPEAEIEKTFGEPPPDADRISGGKHWLIYRARGVDFGLDDHAIVSIVDVFRSERHPAR